MLESPQVHGIVNMCEGKILRSWNVDSCMGGNGQMTCLFNHMPDTVFVDVVGVAEVLLNGTALVVEPMTACVRVMLWILPW